ncbi:DUF433 domain-containing protein [Nodosilinea sp. E11]|uniref:DUF433 domain-containing protein n=1 Tax=Nodosilinea sp. E11 TaxID=3037479 RepID=UPI003977522D
MELTQITQDNKSIWDLVQYRRLGATDAKILEAYPQLTAIDLANACTTPTSISLKSRPPLVRTRLLNHGAALR